MKNRIGHFTRIMIVILSLCLLLGCSANKSQTAAKPDELEVTITSNKEKLKVNEPVKVSAQVKFGTKDISKDAEVEFEIIENGVPVGSVKPKYEGDGRYSLETMFLEKGQQEVIAHVYYKEFHEMPSLSLQLSE